MLGEERRKKIIQELKVATKPVSASNFAKEYAVSRQIIVGDVALIRASGLEIRATSKGYVLATNKETEQFIGKIVCEHTREETETELLLIVQHGGAIMDVEIEHPIYGEIKGNLDIYTIEDVKKFIQNVQQNQVSLLSNLTAGIHLHTIMCQDEETFNEIKKELQAENLLYVEQ